MGMRGMKGDRHTVCDRLFEVREVGDHSLKRIVSEVVTQLLEIGGLILPTLLEP
jgi:hypothetical protein